MKSTYLLAVSALAAPLFAQAPKPQPPPPPGNTASAPAPSASQRVFVLKYADPIQTANLLRAFGARAVPDTEAHAVAVVSAFPDTMAAVDDAIQRLDVPADRKSTRL